VLVLDSVAVPEFRFAFLLIRAFAVNVELPVLALLGCESRFVHFANFAAAVAVFARDVVVAAHVAFGELVIVVAGLVPLGARHDAESVVYVVTFAFAVRADLPTRREFELREVAVIIFDFNRDRV